MPLKTPQMLERLESCKARVWAVGPRPTGAGARARPRRPPPPPPQKLVWRQRRVCTWLGPGFSTVEGGAAMDMFPHVVTVYNTYVETDPSTLEETTANHITVLRGVLLDASKGSNVTKSGLEKADAVNLYIPFSVEAVDGVTGIQRKYVGPVEFWKADDKSDLWTLSVARDSFFIKGEAIHPDWTVQTIEAAYDGVYDITKVDEKDFGGEMAHWEVGGV
nr:MAG TPA: hypothetical protein [Caudoviricetes sp.]